MTGRLVTAADSFCPMTDANQKKLVLVVDDAPSNIQVVQSILKDEYRIRVATNGEKALELARVQPPPDLVLLDVVMPGMDGYEVCRQLKAASETEAIPVIFLTGLTDTDDETRGLDVGAVDYIRKPFSPSIVRARVRTHLLLRDSQEQLNRQVLAINNELELARQIQLSILPSRPPTIPSIEIATRYFPMTAVAGDYYDFLVVDEKRFGILVADVSGHGAPSALITSMLRIALSEQLSFASDPARVLWGLNQALCGKFDRHFITAAYAFIDTEQQLLSYGGAGHPPLVVRSADTGEARAIEENGLLLAQFPDETYTAVQVPFAPGDRAVLYTDGVPECINPLQEEFGTARFLELLHQNHELQAELFVDSVIDKLSQWSEQARGQNQHDDITMLAIDFIAR
jgi:sigma-B regulation protein RsbU (phosphoserine phosphatase)